MGRGKVQATAPLPAELLRLRAVADRARPGAAAGQGDPDHELVRSSDFDYELPKHLIAQHPVEPRDAARLMVVHRPSGQIDHRTFADIAEYVTKPDCLVVNETRVIPARLAGSRAEAGGAVEVLLLRE